MDRRIDARSVLAVLGGAALLVSLFLDWYSVGGTGWQVFEIVDLVLAAIGLAAIAWGLGRVDEGVARWMPAITAAGLVIVVVQVISAPPAARGGDLDAGAWVALGGALLATAGAVLGAAQIRITVDVHGRERRRRATSVDRRDVPAPADAPEARAEPKDATERTAVAERPGAVERPVATGGARAASAGRRPEPRAPDAPDPQATQPLTPISLPDEP